MDNWRWAGVPFYIRSGKRLPKRVTDIAIHFNAAPLSIFSHDGAGRGTTAAPNLLILRIQPDEGISLRFSSKYPGRGMKLRPVSMDFNYGASFGVRSPSAYETLLLDAIARRRDIISAPGHGRSELEGDSADYGKLGRAQLRISELCRRHLGTEGSDEMLARRGHEWRVQ